jgi:hypothetical protein
LNTEAKGVTGDVRVTENKFVQKEVERMKKAREEKERVSRIKDRGIILQQSATKTNSITRP